MLCVRAFVCEESFFMHACTHQQANTHLPRTNIAVNLKDSVRRKSNTLKGSINIGCIHKHFRRLLLCTGTATAPPARSAAPTSCRLLCT